MEIFSPEWEIPIPKTPMYDKAKEHETISAPLQT